MVSPWLCQRELILVLSKLDQTHYKKIKSTQLQLSLSVTLSYSKDENKQKIAQSKRRTHKIYVTRPILKVDWELLNFFKEQIKSLKMSNKVNILILILINTCISWYCWIKLGLSLSNMVLEYVRVYHNDISYLLGTFISLVVEPLSNHSFLLSRSRCL